mgnify:CR=1 FL=1
MKKLKTLLLAFAVIVTLVACSPKNGTGENVDEKSNTNTVETNENRELLPNTYKFPEKELYIDIPDYSHIESGYTELFKNRENKYVTITYSDDNTFENVKEVFDSLYPKFKNNVSSWHSINDETFTSVENVEINGISVQRVIGTVEYGILDKYDCYLYGYSFIFEGVPCAIIGVVTDLDQPQKEIDELTDIVDAMMKSVRKTYKTE